MIKNRFPATLKYIGYFILLYTVFVNFGIHFQKNVLTARSKSLEEATKLGVLINSYEVIVDSTIFYTENHLWKEEIRLLSNIQIWSEYMWSPSFYVPFFSTIEIHKLTQIVASCNCLDLLASQNEEYIFVGKVGEYNDIIKEIKAKSPQKSEHFREKKIYPMMLPRLEANTLSLASKKEVKAIPDTFYIFMGYHRSPIGVSTNSMDTLARILAVKEDTSFEN